METLELSINNPYSYGSLLLLSDDSQELVFDIKEIPESPNDRLYETIQGDTFSNIAYEAYGDSKLWWLIWADSNVENPLELEELPGTILRIPDIGILNDL